MTEHLFVIMVDRTIVDGGSGRLKMNNNRLKPAKELADRYMKKYSGWMSGRIPEIYLDLHNCGDTDAEEVFRNFRECRYVDSVRHYKLCDSWNRYL